MKLPADVTRFSNPRLRTTRRLIPNAVNNRYFAAQRRSLLVVRALAHGVGLGSAGFPPPPHALKRAQRTLRRPAIASPLLYLFSTEFGITVGCARFGAIPARLGTMKWGWKAYGTRLPAVAYLCRSRLLQAAAFRAEGPMFLSPGHSELASDALGRTVRDRGVNQRHRRVGRLPEAPWTSMARAASAGLECHRSTSVTTSQANGSLPEGVP